MKTKKILSSLLLVVVLLAACTPAASADAAAVVQGFWDAMETGDLETALAFVADDVQCRGACYVTGKDSLRSYLQGFMKSQVTEISDLKVDGDTVTYNFKVFRNGLLTQDFEDEVMKIQDGKIIFWENHHA